MENFEQKDFKKQAIDKFLIELEELVTDPKYANMGFDISVIEKIRNGQKIKYDPSMEQILVRVCQDFHLPWQETDNLKKEIFDLE
jgi:hypothetical protein